MGAGLNSSLGHILVSFVLNKLSKVDGSTWQNLGQYPYYSLYT